MIQEILALVIFGTAILYSIFALTRLFFFPNNKNKSSCSSAACACPKAYSASEGELKKRIGRNPFRKNVYLG